MNVKRCSKPAAIKSNIAHVAHLLSSSRLVREATCLPRFSHTIVLLQYSTILFQVIQSSKHNVGQDGLHFPRHCATVATPLDVMWSSLNNGDFTIPFCPAENWSTCQRISGCVVGRARISRETSARNISRRTYARRSPLRSLGLSVVNSELKTCYFVDCKRRETSYSALLFIFCVLTFCQKLHVEERAKRDRERGGWTIFLWEKIPPNCSFWNDRLIREKSSRCYLSSLRQRPLKRPLYFFLWRH